MWDGRCFVLIIVTLNNAMMGIFFGYLCVKCQLSINRVESNVNVIDGCCSLGLVD